ncbi:MAG TPA: 2OG-Fe(II) oxygenase [Allosphingosinicella sp.]|jgi:predicted 2-oxoglutarate/Fe(II)-dependent dioxygenase YbiX/peroxiredoxin
MAGGMSATPPPAQGAAPRLLDPGDTAPWFRAAALDGAPAYAFDTAAGRPMLLLFFGSAALPEAQAALSAVAARRALFDDTNACFFGITCDPADAAERRIAQALPGIRFFLDYDRAVSRLFGAAPSDASGDYRTHWLLLDRTLRVAARFPLAAADAALQALAALAAGPSLPDWAPVAMAPNVLEPAFCRKLVALYEANGGEESGFMREVDGKTVLLKDPNHKQRRDFDIADEDLRRAIVARINRRLVPVVRRAFQFDPTRMERYLVACYEAGAGHFRPHRDNTTKGTAHRRFAVTINLNGDYEGGDLRFPEFGPRTYRAPPGGAIVFSCSLLHEATPVVHGKRYAFLPFLYDEAAAELREKNNVFLSEEVGRYSRDGR